MNVFKTIYNKIFVRKLILFLVEDNSVYSKSVQGFLRTRFPELEIKAFSSGEACLLELRRKPKIIIMDYLLSLHDQNAATGLSIIKKIKATSAQTDIILLSGQTDLKAFGEAISTYGCTYIRKDELAFKEVARCIKGILDSVKS